jgi:hypothetical protein
MIPSYAIDQLRSASVPALIADYVTLNKSGARWKAPCPFHKEKTASFTVYADHWHCFGCGLSGSGIDFLMRIEGMRFPEAAKLLADRIGVSLDDKQVTREQQRYAAEDAEFCQWWWKRNIAAMESAAQRELESGDVEFAGVCSRVLLHHRAMGITERFELYRRESTVRDRKEWESDRQYNQNMEAWWLSLASAQWNI